MLILCSEGGKSREKLPFLTQKPRFCARKAGKWGFRRVKAHKNPDIVLEMPENGGPEGKSAQKPRFCARETNAGLRETESEALGLRDLEFRVVDGLFYHKGGRVFLFYDC